VSCEDDDDDDDELLCFSKYILACAVRDMIIYLSWAVAETESDASVLHTHISGFIDFIQ